MRKQVKLFCPAFQTTGKITTPGILSLTAPLDTGLMTGIPFRLQSKTSPIMSTWVAPEISSRRGVIASGLQGICKGVGHQASGIRN